LKSVLRDKALLIHSNGDSFCTAFTQEVKDKLKQIEQEIISVNQEKDEDVCAEILRKNIIFDFCCNLEHNSSVVKGLNLYHKKKRITLAIWGNPPEWKTKALMVSYLLQQRVTVIGAQHGSFYCEFNVAWDHFDSDFNWCNYYLSYGFNEEDLKETYPWHNKLCTIIPSGHISYTRTSLHKRETIDLLLPLKPCSSFMMEGTDIKSSDLANIQKELLRFLNTFKNKRIVVKLYIGSNDKNSAVLWLLKRLHNLEIISDLSFPQVLERYNVRGVLIESASTTIRDAMASSGNCEVFLLHNTFFQHSTLNKKFKDAMSKSVHIFEELPSLKNAIRVFFDGNSEKKDTDFYRRKYYQRPHTKETVMELIRSVTK
jgi:hypothetical protein